MRRGAFIAILAGLTAGCAHAPLPQSATGQPELPQTFLHAPDNASARALDTLLPIDDASFLDLAASALDSSPTLGQALARIESARASARRASAGRLPQSSVTGNVTVSRTNPGQFGQNNPFAALIDTEQIAYGANVVASWDPDIFGQLRANERSAIAQLEAATASAAAVRIALLAEIAASVTDWRTLDARLLYARRDLAAANQIASLLRIRQQAGLATGIDHHIAEAQADAARSRIAALDDERVRIVARLVALTGQDAHWVNSTLQQGGPTPRPRVAPASLPSQLLMNRPDLLAASARLAASDAALDAAARTRFPKLTLSAALGLLAFDPGDLFDEQSIVGSLAAGIAAPLLDFGRIEAEINRAEAEKMLAFEAYRGAVFQALADAEAAYGLVETSDRQASHAEAEREALERATSLANARYRSGLSSLVEVLEARRAADASGERAALALGRAERARILLWQALGGGEFGAVDYPTTRSTSQ
ncbi:efflux transporter outer membrane subunit [Qipengyuania nanhaisediminis]|uniref:efflux transporter outer membrane subunit n=1 Tax=Qipengyuania nanhaisediminis TaxID=604088 RepID=UPI0038B2AA1A